MQYEERVEGEPVKVGPAGSSTVRAVVAGTSTVPAGSPRKEC